MKKPQVNNVASVGIIYNEHDPEKIFIEMKDGGLPIKPFQWTLCPIGGNWVGDGAKDDASPLETFRREVKEEFRLKTVARNWNELAELGHNIITTDGRTITGDDSRAFQHLRDTILASAKPWRDYLVPSSARVLNMVPGSKSRDGFLTLVSYNLVALAEEDWATLMDLQQRFENLSNESCTWAPTLQHLVAMGTHFAYGHERAFQAFWLEQRCSEARDLALFPHDPVILLGKPHDNYKHYLENFEILRHP